jgi:hypothetical protein
MMSVQKSLVSVLLVFTLVTVNYATMTLNVDTDAKELYFTGSTTGRLADVDGSQMAIWMGGEDSDDNDAIPLTGTFSSSQNVDSFSALQSNGSTGSLMVMFVFMGADLASDITFTGTGTRVSYAGLDQDHIDAIEGYAGVLPILYGSDFDTIAVTYVPEPATFALLGLGGLLIRRRKRA